VNSIINQITDEFRGDRDLHSSTLCKISRKEPSTPRFWSNQP